MLCAAVSSVIRITSHSINEIFCLENFSIKLQSFTGRLRLRYRCPGVNEILFQTNEGLVDGRRTLKFNDGKFVLVGYSNNV